MSFPTSIEAITPAFLSNILGRRVTAVSAAPLGEPYMTWVATLEVSLADGDTEHLVAKVRRPGRGNVRMYSQEVHFYRAIAGRLDCVPRHRFAEIGSDGDFLLVLDHVGGRHVREGFDAATAKSALERIAQVHGRRWGAEILELPVRTYSPDEAARLVQTIHTSWDHVAARFPRHLAAPPPLDRLPSEVTHLEATALTHNDLHAENVLVDGDRVMFVDWQNATWSTPMLDVANLISGCVHPDVQRAQWRELLAHWEAALLDAGGPQIPDVVERYATTTGMLFGWMMRYLADVSDDEAADRSMLLDHWQRVCTGVVLPR